MQPDLIDRYQEAKLKYTTLEAARAANAARLADLERGVNAPPTVPEWFRARAELSTAIQTDGEELAAIRAEISALDTQLTEAREKAALEQFEVHVQTANTIYQRLVESQAESLRLLECLAAVYANFDVEVKARGGLESPAAMPILIIQLKMPGAEKGPPLSPAMRLLAGSGSK